MLQAELLTKKYNGHLVVDRLSMSVEKGDIFGFLGQNGAGKSTVIRMILGLVRPTSGRVLLFGQDASKFSLNVLGRVGALVEAPAFYGNFSGFDNLRMFAALSGGASRKRIEHVLELVDLLPRARDLVRSYSHGMRQRLGLAQALLPNPSFVILDEPTDGLDPQGIREVRLLLPRLRDELGLTILLSSHLLSEVECICNNVGIIDQGRMRYQGSVNDLIKSDTVVRISADPIENAYQLLALDETLRVSRNGAQFLYVRVPDERIPHINALLVRNGIRVKELSPQRATLEEIFTTVTSEWINCAPSQCPPCLRG